MSPKVYAVGREIRGNGKDKVDPGIENELAATRPPSALSRRDAVFCLEHTDFTICGITEPGYIYRVEPPAARSLLHFEVRSRAAVGTDTYTINRDTTPAPAITVTLGLGPASESLQGRNPWVLAVGSAPMGI